MRRVWGREICIRGFGGGSLRERDNFEDLDVDITIILKSIFKKCEGGGTWTGLIWLRIGTREGSCDCGNEPSGSINCGEFLDWLGNC